jgi:hypothetical protein
VCMLCIEIEVVPCGHLILKNVILRGRVAKYALINMLSLSMQRAS